MWAGCSAVRPFSLPEGSCNGVLRSWGGAEQNCAGLRHGRGTARCPPVLHLPVPVSPARGCPQAPLSEAQQRRMPAPCQLCGACGISQLCHQAACREPRAQRASNRAGPEPLVLPGERGGDTAGLGAEPSCAPPSPSACWLGGCWGETEAGRGEENSSRGNSGAMQGIGTRWVPTSVMLSPSQCRGGLQKGMRVPPAPPKQPLTPPKHPGGSLLPQPAATAR